MNKTISIIIPNYNGKKLLELNLPFIIKLKEKWTEICEIIIVDDKSTDESTRFLEDNSPQIIIIKKDKNTGFIDSVNLGVQKAQGELVLLLNTDVDPRGLNIEKLTKYFTDNNVFAVGCLDKSVENNKTINRGRGIGLFKQGLLIHKRGKIDENSTLWVSGGSSMFRKAIWERLGGFDPLYTPFYWEDIDISYRALKLGYKIYFEKEAVVTHTHLQGAILTNYNSRQIHEISLRNQLLFVWKNITDFEYILQNKIFILKYVFAALINRDLIFIKAFTKAVKRLPKIFTYRFSQQQKFIYKDREILNKFADEFKTQ